MTKRVTYFVIGSLSLFAVMIAFQLRAESAYAGRINTAFMSGAFLTVYGTLSACVMILFYNRLMRFESQLVAAFLAVATGLWTLLLSSPHLPLMSAQGTAVFVRVFQYLTVPLVYLYLGLKPGRFKRRLFRLSAAACAVLSVLPLVAGGAFSAALYLAVTAWTFWFVIQDITKDVSAGRAFSTETLLLYGVAGLCVIMLFNGLCRLLQGILSTDALFFLQFLYPLASSLYLMALTFSFSVFVSESYAKYDENAVLFHAAYEDPLTGLSNRAAWDEKMKEVDEQPHSYCIISLDLDGLKGVNDTWGHEAGDRLIKGFARSLADAFTEPHFLARIGGDEFCVIMEDVTEEEVKRRLRSLDTRLGILNRRDKEVNHSCSYGYAFRDAEKGTAHEIYLEADAKMYATKQMHKAQRKADALTKQDSAETKVANLVMETLAAMSPESAAAQAKTEEAKTQAAPSAPQGAKTIAGAGALGGANADRQRAKPLRMIDPRKLRRANLSKEEQSMRTLQKIQDTEIQQVAKEVRVKKALKALEDAQKQQSGQ